MCENVEKIVKSAAVNVACESKSEVSKETLENIRNQLLGVTNHSDESFIYKLYESVVEGENLENGKTRSKKTI